MKAYSRHKECDNRISGYNDSMSAPTSFTAVINLLSLAASLWLGFYIMTRSPYSAPSRLAALMLWSLATYFACNALLSSLPHSVVLSWLRQEAVLILPLLLHLTARLLPNQARTPGERRLAQINRLSVPLAYAVAVALIALGVLPGGTPVGLFDTPSDSLPDPALPGFMSRTASQFYLLFLVFLLVVCLFSLLNLWYGRQLARNASLRQTFSILFVAAALAGLGGVYAAVGTWLHLSAPTTPADILYAVAIFLLGYAVARHAALLEGRPMDRDFLYALLVVGSLTAFYVLIVWLLYVAGHVDFLTLVLTIIGTIAAASLFDAVRTALDRVFYQSQFLRLRSNLRIFAREAGTGGALPERLQAILTSLCRMFRIKRGFIALSEDNQWIIRATNEANPIGQVFALPALAATETIGLLHPRGIGLSGMVLMVPLFAEDRQIGALVLGAKESRQPYSEADLELLEDVGDQMAALIHTVRLQEENAQTINAMVQDFREKERTLQWQTQQMLVAKPGAEQTQRVAGGAEEALLLQVEDALRHLHDFSYLGEQQLAKLQVVEQCWTKRPQVVVTSIERGKALNDVLIRALDQLRPNDPAPGRESIPPRAWHQFIILHDSYVLNEPTRNIMSRLYIGEGTFNRTRRRALSNLAKSLAEMEQNLISPI